MIGCILTGHGEFAPGLAAAVTMIAGKQEHFEVVTFREDEPLETFEGNLKTAIEKLLSETKGVVVFTDLLGGTPFRYSMVAAAEHDQQVEVITGTNLPMLIESLLIRTMEDSASALATKAVNVGKEGVQNPQLQVDTAEDEEDDMEGI